MHVVCARRRRGGFLFNVSVFFCSLGSRASCKFLTGDRFVSAPEAMADQEAPRRGVRRAAAKADREAENRRVRQRLDEMETRLDWSESVGRSHEQRISFQESPQRIVLRGFACVPEFFRTRGGDFKVAKRAFIGGFIHELREKCGAEVNHLLDEAEGLLAERDGWGVLGVYPTGGMWGDVPDGLLRLQPGYVGDRVGYLLCMSSRFFTRFTPDVPRPSP